MKQLLIALSILFTLSFGFQSYVSANPAQGIKIHSNRVNGGIGWTYGSKEVYAEFKNFTNNTVSISWQIVAKNSSGNTVVVGSGNATVSPQETYRSQSFPKNYSLTDYELVWNFN